MTLKIDLFTDTYADLNGVSRFIQNLADQAHAAGNDLRVVTSLREPGEAKPNVVNYKPHVTKRLAAYPQQEVSLPPAWAMLIDTIKRKPDVIHASTPGPVGMIGVLAATILGKPLTGVYHTDFPAYIRDLYKAKGVHWAADVFIKSFYKRFTGIFARSPEYLQVLRNMGLPADALHDLRPGIDTRRFHPRHHDPGIWSRLGMTARPKVLYVGRISREKNLHFLANAWQEVRKRGLDADLVVVGEGPWRDEMHASMPDAVHFLGRRTGIELSAIYASADLFVFPSTTDTLGQVVMEAQASGLPCVVSDVGGPQWAIEDGVTGAVLPVDTARWANAIIDLVEQHATRQSMSVAAHERMQGRDFERSFDEWWRLQNMAWTRHVEHWAHMEVAPAVA